MGSDRLHPQQEIGMREAVEAGLHGPAEIRRGPEGFQFWAGGRMWFDGTGRDELRCLMPWLNGSQNILAEIDALRSENETLRRERDEVRAAFNSEVDKISARAETAEAALAAMRPVVEAACEWMDAKTGATGLKATLALHEAIKAYRASQPQGGSE